MDKVQLQKFLKHAVEIAQAGWRVALGYLHTGWRIAVRIYHYCRMAAEKYWPIIVNTVLAWLRVCGRHCVKIYHRAATFIVNTVRVWLRACGRHCVKIYHQAAAIISAVLQRSVRWVQTHWPYVRDRLYQYAQLARLHRPIGIFLLLWPALWALWFAAEGVPDIFILLIFVAGVVAMRSAGCVINDIADRNIDPHVARTSDRPLPAGTVSVREALTVAGVLILIAFLLVLTLDPLTVKLSFIGAALAILYPYTKRYTYIPQLFLGLAFGWAVPMAFAAQAGSVSVSGWIIFMATVLWAVAYDTEYAMVDREDDIRMGVKSTAILFEDADRAIIALIQALVLIALALAGGRLGMSWMFYSGLAAAAVSALYQQYLITDRIPGQCFRAFRNNNWFGLAVFAGIFLHYQFY